MSEGPENSKRVNAANTAPFVNRMTRGGQKLRSKTPTCILAQVGKVHEGARPMLDSITQL